MAAEQAKLAAYLAQAEAATHADAESFSVATEQAKLAAHAAQTAHPGDTPHQDAVGQAGQAGQQLRAELEAAMGYEADSDSSSSSSSSGSDADALQQAAAGGDAEGVVRRRPGRRAAYRRQVLSRR